MWPDTQVPEFRRNLQTSSYIPQMEGVDSSEVLLSVLQAAVGIARAERDGTRAETRFSLSLKRTSPCKSVGASVQSSAGSRGVRISLSNTG